MNTDTVSYEATLEAVGNAADALIDAFRLINPLGATHGYAETTGDEGTIEIAYLAVGPNTEAVWVIDTTGEVWAGLFTNRDAARATFEYHVDQYENAPDFDGWDQRTGWAV